MINRLYIFLFLIFISASNSAFAQITPLSNEAKKQSLVQLEQMMESGKFNTELEKTRPNNTYSQQEAVTSKSQGKKNYYFQNGKYKVLIKYQLDSDFPKMSGESYSFRENKSQTFKDQWSQIIYEHYLGSNFQDYEPEVYAVTKGVSIFVLIDDLDQLTILLEDPRVISTNHIGTPQVKPLETH